MSYDVFLIGEFNLNILVKTAWRYSNSKYFFFEFWCNPSCIFFLFVFVNQNEKNAEMLEMSLKSYQSFKNPVNFSFWRISMKFLHNVVLYKHSLKNIFWQFSYPYGYLIYEVTTEERWNSKFDTLLSSTIFQVCNWNFKVYLYISCHKNE